MLNQDVLNIIKEINEYTVAIPDICLLLFKPEMFFYGRYSFPKGLNYTKIAHDLCVYYFTIAVKPEQILEYTVYTEPMKRFKKIVSEYTNKGRLTKRERLQLIITLREQFPKKIKPSDTKNYHYFNVSKVLIESNLLYKGGTNLRENDIFWEITDTLYNSILKHWELLDEHFRYKDKKYFNI